MKNNIAVQDKRTAVSAKCQAAGNADYDVPGIKGLSLHTGVRYYGDACYEDINRVLIADHTLATAGFQYRTEMYGHGVTFKGNVNNLFNTKYRELNPLGEGLNGALSVKVNW